MDAIIVTGASAKEIAALVLAVQERHEKKNEKTCEREMMIQEYERRLRKLKEGTSPADVIFQI